MIGLVLCSGISLKNETEKNTLENNNSLLVTNAANKLATLNIPVFVSVNKEQYLQYQSVFSSYQLVEDAPILDFEDALRGLLSTHILHPNSSIFILGSHLGATDATVLHYLTTQFRIHTNADALVLSNEEGVEPLCGIYSSKALATILNDYKHGHLQVHTIKHILERIQTTVLPIPTE